VEVLVEELLELDPFDDEDPLEELLVDAALPSEELLLDELPPSVLEPLVELSDLAAVEVECEPFLDSERESVR